MPKRIKDKWLGSRTYADHYQIISDYADAVEIDVAELIRLAVDEYMTNHPVKRPVEPLADTLKPGKEQAWQ